MTTQNLWDAAKAVLRGKFTAIQSYLKKEEKHRTDNLTLHLKQLENLKKKIGRRKEIIKFRADIIEKEIRGRWEKGLGWGIHVNPWLIHFNV